MNDPSDTSDHTGAAEGGGNLTFERTVQPATMSGAVPKPTQERGFASPSKQPAAPPDSRARRLLDLDARERAAAEREERVRAAEERFLPKSEQDRLVVERFEQEAVQWVTSHRSELPILNELGLAREVPRYIQAAYQQSGRLLEYAEVARALEEHYSQLASRAQAAASRSRPSSPAWTRAPVSRETHRDWDLRPLDEDERYRRALEVFDLVSRRGR